MAVLHVVLMQPRAGTTDEEVDALWRAMDGLRSTVPGIDDVVCGPSSSPEGLEQGYTLGFVVRFVDAAARDGYLPHPAHLAVVPLVQVVAERVLVYDLEVPG